MNSRKCYLFLSLGFQSAMCYLNWEMISWSLLSTVEGIMVWQWASIDETLLFICKQLYFLNYNPMVQDQFSGLCFAVHFVARQVHGQIVTEAIGMRMLVSEFFNVWVTYPWYRNWYITIVLFLSVPAVVPFKTKAIDQPNKLLVKE